MLGNTHTITGAVALYSSTLIREFSVAILLLVQLKY